MPSKNYFSFAVIRASSSALIFSLLLGAPISTLAAETNLEVSGWIPYWRTETGTNDALEHIQQFTEVNPFAYAVRTNGTLNDIMNLDHDAWQELIEEAGEENVRVVPTIMWSDTNNIHAVLSDPAKRAKHIDSIMDIVNENDFDGVDIDYEGKLASTKDAYATFLKKLSAELKKGNSPKWLQCTIEARMPLEARYSGTPPPNIEYANDLPRINQYCDRVRIMTYDQRTADIQLNRAYSDELYAPIADTAWVKKVIDYMAEDIDKDKLMMGIATYGSVWQAMPNLNGKGYTYIKLEAFNPSYGIETAEEYDITPVRGFSGELGFSYVPKDMNSSLPSQKELSREAPRGTVSAYLAALGALAYAREENRQAPIRYLTWSDAEAIEQKIELAEDLGIRGVSIFKIDGGADLDVWDVLPEEAVKRISAPKGSFVTEDKTPARPTVNPGISYTFSQDLVYGDTSTEVLRLQSILISEGYLDIPTPTHFFGPMTLTAVRAWQEANGIPNTGNFGPLSRAEMARGN